MDRDEVVLSTISMVEMLLTRLIANRPIVKGLKVSEFKRKLLFDTLCERSDLRILDLVGRWFPKFHGFASFDF